MDFSNKESFKLVSNCLTLEFERCQNDQFWVQDLDGDIIETENPQMMRTSPIRECSKSVRKKR